MELWFWLAVVTAVIGGIPPFLTKVAAYRNYDAGLFLLLGSVSKALIVIPLALLVADWSTFNIIPFMLGFLVGAIAMPGAMLRITALRHIDATLYFPLHKVLSPTMVILAGVILFSESFTWVEWLGLIGGVIVPLLLISPSENSRQSNLRAGLILIVVTAFLSGVGAIINKFNVDSFVGTTLWILAGNATGFLLVALVQYVVKKRGFIKAVQFINTVDRSMIILSLIRGLLLVISIGSGLYALALGGPVGIVYTIGALYILIPIILSIIFFNEHWNWQKALAIVLSVVSLAFLG